MKAIPASYTVKNRIGLYLHSNPDATIEQILGAIKGPRSVYVKTQVEELAEDEFIFKGANGGYQLAKRYSNHFDQLAIQPKAHVEVVPARTAAPFKPLKSLPTDIHLGRYRDDVSFHNGSTDFKSFIGYTI